MQQSKGLPSPNEWALPSIVFVGVCAIFMGKIILPILFLLWIGLGWKVALLAARHLVVGSEGVKNAVGIGAYLAVVALISALAIIL